ncbi:hypothetical protein BJV78DRAFT_1285245 [Lactifluus subvellereus]|nr:hypothetical protein BJV78DRAFT_1285245 [Lactifluus subvellereus]
MYDFPASKSVLDVLRLSAVCRISHSSVKAYSSPSMPIYARAPAHASNPAPQSSCGQAPQDNDDDDTNHAHKILAAHPFYLSTGLTADGTLLRHYADSYGVLRSHAGSLAHEPRARTQRLDHAGRLLRRVHLSGWAETGARNVIAAMMTDVYAVADAILADYYVDG